jgi:release factor glutamine methyltransferase
MSPVSISEALQRGVAALQQARIAEPRRTAEVLLGHVLGKQQAFLYAHGEEALSSGHWTSYWGGIEQRLRGKPTQYITGVQEFFGLPFRVTPDVLIPRPETELLVEQALERVRPGDWVLDIGTGSGAIAITIRKHRPGAKVVASDLSGTALSVARGNAHDLDSVIPLVQADMAEAFLSHVFDIVVCNPPYISSNDLSSVQREVRDYEPHLALLGGEDGLRAYRYLSSTACEVLRPGGWLLMEVGYNTSAAIKPMFAAGPWESPLLYRDLAGWERVMAVKRLATSAAARPSHGSYA